MSVSIDTRYRRESHDYRWRLLDGGKWNKPPCKPKPSFFEANQATRTPMATMFWVAGPILARQIMGVPSFDTFIALGSRVPVEGYGSLLLKKTWCCSAVRLWLYQRLALATACVKSVVCAASSAGALRARRQRHIAGKQVGGHARHVSHVAMGQKPG